MSNNIEAEILRLVKEIADDEESLIKAERYTWSADKADKIRCTIDRKLKLLDILKK